MEGKASLGVRKGAWTQEEDDLLKHCINKYGEGNWSKVPTRAGLKRCRKSCRMRWMNYLKQDINNREFAEDEVDLLLQLHKLLGNRWSLIAGRLPGRTSDSVKNYCNTHLRKKVLLEDHQKHLKDNDPQKILTKSNIIKPPPRTISKHLPSMNASSTKIQPQNDNQSEPSPLEDTSLWKRLLDDHGNSDEVITHFLSWSEEELLPNYFSIEELDQHEPHIEDIINDDYWKDSMDMNLWGPFDI